MKIAKDVTELIGNTPLVKMNRIMGNNSACVYAKLEYFNPGGSVKDRIAKSLIADGEKSGKINKKTVIIEPTSGNTGIGLALVCAVKGYRLVLTIPENLSTERQMILKAYGAEIELTPASEGMKGAIKRAEQLSEKYKYSFIPQQFENQANPEAHRKTTALEIWDATQVKIDIFISGVGTGGTITGISEILKEKKPGLLSIAVEPKNSAVLSGGSPGPHNIQGIGAGFVPAVLNREIIDEVIKVSDEDAAAMTRKLTREEGIFAGISAGAAAYGAFVAANRKEYKDKIIVYIIPDTGERYLSTTLYE